MVEMAIAFALKYPATASVLMVMGVLRAVFKPLFALLQAYVASTPSAADDAVLARIEKSKVVTTAAFVLDYVASIKLPQK